MQNNKKEFRSAEERYEEHEKLLNQIIKLLQTRTPASAALPKLLDNGEVMSYFKISETTAKDWRRDGVLPHIKVNNRVYYLAQDIEALILKNRKAI